VKNLTYDVLLSSMMEAIAETIYCIDARLAKSRRHEDQSKRIVLIRSRAERDLPGSAKLREYGGYGICSGRQHAKSSTEA
jgi:hypothetical protein